STIVQPLYTVRGHLTLAERQDRTTWLQLHGTALQARRDGESQLRQAEEAFRQGRTQAALTFIKSIAPNQQFLTVADKQRLQRLSDQVMPGQSGSSPAAGTGSAPAVAQARSKLKQARLLMGRGNYDAAQALAQEADHLHAPLLPGEDTPQKVLEDIGHARTLVVPSNDAKALVSAARAALNRGELNQ